MDGSALIMFDSEACAIIFSTSWRTLYNFFDDKTREICPILNTYRTQNGVLQKLISTTVGTTLV